MPFPKPLPGLVLHYGYLWQDEHQAGSEEGSKDRPCIIVSVDVLDEEKKTVEVLLAPITHKKPAEGAGIELGASLRKALKLDDRPCWVITNDTNLFIWPGPDLNKIPRSQDAYHYGMIPPKLLIAIQDAIKVSNLAATKRVA